MDITNGQIDEKLGMNNDSGNRARRWKSNW